MSKPCPNDEIFADYIEGRLSEEQRLEMEDHISACDSCLEEFVIAGSVLREEDASQFASVPTGVTQAAVRLLQSHDAGSCPTLSTRVRQSLESLSGRVADILTFKPWTGMQLEPIRGSKQRLAQDLIRLRKQFRDFETEIEIEKTGEGKAHIRVKLMAPAKDEKPVRVTLMKGEREMSSQLLSGPKVLFEDVPFGHYGLTFSRDGVELGEYHFEIRENRHGEG